MRTIQPFRAALTFALLLGGFHVFWAVLVATRLAQPLSDLLFRIHFIRPVYVIEPFQLGLAALLVAITTAVGALVGWAFAVIWNWMGGPSPTRVRSRGRSMGGERPPRNL